MSKILLCTIPKGVRSIRAAQARWASMILSIGAVGLLCAGSWSWREQESRTLAGAALAFQPTTCEVGPIACGQARLVSIQVINRDRSRPVFLFGAEDHCNPQGCVAWKGKPTTIPPGESVTFDVEWKGTKLGRITQKIPIYTDAPGQAEVVLTIIGEVVPTQAVAATPP